MPTFRKGDMFAEWAKEPCPCHALLVTGNGDINSRGGLVMGRGAARQLLDLYPECAKIFAELIHVVTDPSDRFYGLVVYGGPRSIIGVLQVKDHWHEDAKLHLIAESLKELRAEAEMFPERIIFLNFPGIGNGRLEREAVLPLLEWLPDNVHVWESE